MNWLDIVLLLILVAGLGKGLYDGFVKQITAFIALLFAFFFAGEIAIPAREFLIAHLTGNAIAPTIMSGVCYVLAFVLIIVVITLLGKLIGVAIKMTPAKPLDILLGGLFGLFVWALSLSIVINVISVFDTRSWLISPTAQEKSQLYTPVKSIVPTVYPKLKNYFN
ncbi:MAG: CvpA family protein [Candidatus Symbiothrix sp.]|jgi:membrane protein required for colicin V production|nr:CvpA family protein [Candidatus Symbiothrix sp.]